MKTRRTVTAITLVSVVAVGSFTAGVPSAVAAGNASITLATPQLVAHDAVEHGHDVSHDEHDVFDGDSRADDLIIAFTESGTGNSKGAVVEVSATRTVTVTCVNQVRKFSTSDTQPLTWFDGDDSSDPTTFSEPNDQKGKWVLSGTFMVRTNFNEICARSPGGKGGEIYFVKDYSVTYTDVTVRDSQNGVEASDPGPYSFQDSLEGGFTTPDAELAGLSCTIEDLERGHCESA